MKIIILSAGRGERLMPLTRDIPKPLLQLANGRTLLDTQIEGIGKSGLIDEIILLIGYKQGQIEAKIKEYREEIGINIKTIYNPFFDTSGNLITLWLAKPEMTMEFLISNGDNIFEWTVYRDLIQETGNGITMTISKKHKYDDDDMKVILEGNIVKRVSKEITNKNADCESVGLIKVAGEKYIAVFKEALESLARTREHINDFWLEVFNKLSRDGVPIRIFEIDGKSKWQEIDFHPDIKKTRRLIGL